MEIQLGSLVFINKTKAEEYIRNILSRYNSMRPLQGRDREIIDSVLDLHPNKHVIVDCGIKDILVQWLDDRGEKRRFIAKRVDSSIRDFTWRHALYPRSEIQSLRRTCRTLVQDQIAYFRRQAFGRDLALECLITGDRITEQTCDVDHAAPDTFNALVDRWLSSCGINAEDIEIVPSRHYQFPDAFQDEVLAQAWREFHKINARLRVVSIPANRSILRKTKERWATPFLTQL